ncbi:MAG: murein transglycosylase A [Erythrobacter sp.]|uniref:murein transglycosylase A n=1 Tax=Erythrobacter sp. TaxID=1042 RepID=UPI002630C427|nr:murein transglycosylase A [Erythrobacter sp.]MDJ0979307.1 murein transglycosylase A [Erythrobacter sp.]
MRERRAPGKRWPVGAAPLATVTLVAACVGPGDRPPASVSAPDVPSAGLAGPAILAGVTSGSNLSDLPLSRSRDALAAFSASCPQLLARTDQSGLTAPADWRPACRAADSWPGAQAQRFFETYFEPVTIGDGKAFATGYFVPEIEGSREPREGYVPVYGLPEDLERGWPEDVPASERTGRAPLARRLSDGSYVPYFDRAAIEQGALDGRAPVLAWVADPVEFFFLQIQGSGRIRTPEGEVINIGYAGQNGRGYTSVGKLMRERGLLGDGPGQYPGSMQGIMAYMRENPEQGRALMRENESWIFFRELDGGAVGAMGVPVTGVTSLAVDPLYVPLGAPVWLDLDRDEADGLWIAQDTGGAIKGVNRFDTFWGAGREARAIAGGMSGRGTAQVLLPKEAAGRLTTAK